MVTIGIDIRNIGKKRTGDEVVFFNLVKSLAKIDSQNEYLLFTDITNTTLLPNMVKDMEIQDKPNFKIVSLKVVVVQPLQKFIWNFWTLPKYLRRNPVDIYLTQYITPFFVSRKIKILTIIHDISFNFFPQFIKKSDLFFLKLLIPRSLQRADKIIAVSEFTKNEIIKFYKIAPEKLTVAYNAIGDDFLKLDVSAEKIKAVGEKYKLPENYILYLGTLQPRKNIPVLIAAFASVKNEINNAKLVIAGGKGYNYDRRIDETIAKFNLKNEVFFPGYIDEGDKAALLKGADIFCFPSLYEGFGIPILEAMSAGTPVIASDIAPHQEIANGSALFFNPQNSAELAEKIKELYSNNSLRESLAQEGRAQAQKFSWGKTALDVLALFNTLA